MHEATVLSTLGIASLIPLRSFRESSKAYAVLNPIQTKFDFYVVHFDGATEPEARPETNCLIGLTTNNAVKASTSIPRWDAQGRSKMAYQITNLHSSESVHLGFTISRIRLDLCYRTRRVVISSRFPFHDNRGTSFYPCAFFIHPFP